MEKNNTPESLIKFPCDFPVKAIGYANEPIADILTEIVHRHANYMDYIPVTVNTSKQAKYTAATVTVKARSKEQLDKIYKDLADHEKILMVF